MPAKSEKQRRFFGAEMGRAKEGKKTKSGMSIYQLEEMLGKKKSKKHGSS